jgi:hypothetical protein
MSLLKYRYQLLKENIAEMLEIIDHQTEQHLHITAREIVSNTDILMELHPLDIRLVCLLAMQEYYEKVHPRLALAQSSIRYKPIQ